MYFLCRGTNRAPVVRATASGLLPPFLLPRVRATRACACPCESHGNAVAARIRRTPAYRHRPTNTPRPPRVCAPSLLCVTRIIRALCAGTSPAPPDLDKSEIAVAEVRPRVSHLARAISESRAVLNLTDARARAPV